MIHTIINYLSFIPIPLLLALLFLFLRYRKAFLKNKVLLILTTFFILASFLLIYGRFVEPNMIEIKSTDIEVGFPGKIVLIADTHIGVYANSNFLKRVVEKINTIENVDVVVIAGDITYYPKKNLTELLSPFKDLRYPAFAVLGNHDTGDPGPNIRNEIEVALKEAGVVLLRNNSARIDARNISLLGLGELWDNDADIKSLNTFESTDNLVVVAHNPDTTHQYKEVFPDLTISGHTHGGQIRIPFIYKYFIPSKYGFDQGLYVEGENKVFVSSGLGLTGLPYRLGVRPVIDILNLY